MVEKKCVPALFKQFFKCLKMEFYRYNTALCTRMLQYFLIVTTVMTNFSLLQVLPSLMSVSFEIIDKERCLN